MTDIDFSKINIESLLYTSGDYYLYEIITERFAVLRKSKFKNKDIFLRFVRAYANGDQVLEFEKNGYLRVQDGDLVHFFKKVGNP